MRKVTFADGVRGGLLGQAAIMTATSYPEPHLARAARQVAARQHPRDRRRRRRRPTCRRSTKARRRPGRCRSASRWRPIAATRPARRATCAWTRWGSRWRTSTRSGKWRTATRRRAGRRRGHLPDGSEHPRRGRAEGAHRGRAGHVRADVHREAAGLRSRPRAWRRATCRRCARSPRAGRRGRLSLVVTSSAPSPPAHRSR